MSHVTFSSHVSFGRWALCSQPVPVQGSCSQAFDTLTMKYLGPHGIRKASWSLGAAAEFSGGPTQPVGCWCPCPDFAGPSEEHFAATSGFWLLTLPSCCRLRSKLCHKAGVHIEVGTVERKHALESTDVWFIGFVLWMICFDCCFYRICLRVAGRCLLVVFLEIRGFQKAIHYKVW